VKLECQQKGCFGMVIAKLLTTIQVILMLNLKEIGEGETTHIYK